MATSWSSWYWHLGGASSLVMAGAIAFCADCAHAQITPDASLGAESSVVTPSVVINSITTNQIDGGAIRGASLFHSFEEFSVPTGGSAYFNNALDVRNIISRVTGKSISNINGLLRTNGTANLFLLNPNGIIFGPNATLSIGGSFLATTANSLNFADGTQFSATAHPTTPLLTVSVLIGLQYGPQAGEIRVQGPGAVRGQSVNAPLLNREAGLSVRQSETLALVASGVALEDGILTTDGGRIELGSVAGPSLVSLIPIDSGWALGYEGVLYFRDIQLSGAAAVDASGSGGGDIQVRGRRLTLTNGSQIEASTLGSEPGGTFNVTTSESVELIGTSTDRKVLSGLFAQIYPGATGTGGNVTLETGQLILRDGAQISTVAFGQGKGGNLVVTTSDKVNLVGSGSGLFSQSQGASTSGDLSITTRHLSVQGGAVVSTSTSSTSKEGQQGNLTVTASDEVKLFGTSGLFTQTQGAQDAGNLTITTRRLSVGAGALVSATTFAEGKGGNLAVTASDEVKLFGTSGLFTQTQGAGDAGDLTITTRQLSVKNGAVVSAFALGPGDGGDIKVNASNSVNIFGVSSEGSSSGLFTRTANKGGQAGNIMLETSAFRIADSAVVDTRTLAAGNGGSVTVNANTFEAVDGGQILSSTRSSGNAGSIALNVTGSITLSGSDPTYTDRLERFGDAVDNEGAASGLFANTTPGSTGNGSSIFIDPIQLTITDGAGISVDSLGEGNAGNLQVQAGSITLEREAFLSATTASGQGGDITLRSQDLLLMRRNSNISSSAGGTGNGGNINIDADFVIALPSEDSNIIADAIEGRGGNIQITTQSIFGIQPREQQTSNSDINASSQLGIAGTVQINTPDTDPSQGLATLPAELVDASRLIASSCAAVGESKFTITGRGGLPPSPSEVLSSDAVWVDFGTLNPKVENRSSPPVSTNPTAPEPAPIVEAQGWVINGKGEVMLTANAPNVTPHSPWIPSATCQTPQAAS